MHFYDASVNCLSRWFLHPGGCLWPLFKDPSSYEHLTLAGTLGLSGCLGWPGQREALCDEWMVKGVFSWSAEEVLSVWVVLVPRLGCWAFFYSYSDLKLDLFSAVFELADSALKEYVKLKSGKIWVDSSCALACCGEYSGLLPPFIQDVVTEATRGSI